MEQLNRIEIRDNLSKSIMKVRDMSRELGYRTVSIKSSNGKMRKEVKSNGVKVR